MSVIKINAITVPAETGDLLAQRFAPHAKGLDNVPGAEGFELLQPTDGRDIWLVVSRWKDEESYQAWLESDNFRKSHARGEDGRTVEGHQKPAGVSSEVWSYAVAVSSEQE